MDKAIRIKMRGTQDHGTDAPTVRDFLTQIEDCLTMLEYIEDAVTAGSVRTAATHEGGRMLAWRVTGLSQQSPCSVIMTPSMDPALATGTLAGLANEVAEVAANGLQHIITEQDIYPNFPVTAVARARKICKRVLNGLGTTTIEFAGYSKLPKFVVTRENAKASIAAMKSIQADTRKTGGYRELGSIEGFVVRMQRDTKGQPVLYIRTRLDNKMVRCTFSKNKLGTFGKIGVKQLVSDMRVAVNGVIEYDGLDNVKRVVVDDVYVYRPESELPQPEDMIVPNFANGVSVATLLEEIRQND